MNNPITQSREWQKLQEDLKETSFFEKTDDFQYLAILKTTPVGNYLYCPYGPVAADKTSLKKALKSLKNLATEHKAIFIRIEPQLQLTREALRSLAKSLKLTAIKSKDLSPAETWILNLPHTTEENPLDNGELKAILPSRLLRYYKNHAKSGLTIRTSKNPTDIAHLLKLQRALADQKHINTFSEHYLETELNQPFATLYLVDYQNPDTKQSEIVAAGLVFDDQNTRYNLQGAQSGQGRKLHATGILTIRLIEDAVKSGKTTFDFWGIAPDNAPKNHPWAGFTAFKKTFAGHEKCYTGTYDLALNPVRYKIYQLTRFLRQTISSH